MSSRIPFLLPLIAMLGCGTQPPPAPPALPADVKPAEAAPAVDKVEPKPAFAPKAPEPPPNLKTLDLRRYGLFAAVDAPEGTHVEQSGEALVFLTGGHGAKLREGAADLNGMKESWRTNVAFKLKSLPIDEPDALVGEIDSGMQSQYLARVNVRIGDKPYHWEEYFVAGQITSEKAKGIVAWARTLRQTKALRDAQEHYEAAEKELRKRGAIFPTPNSVMISLVSPVDESVFDLLRAIPTLESLAFINCGPVAPGGVSILEALPELKHLTLQGCAPSAAVVGAIGHLSGLRTLAIDGPGVNDATIRPLGNLRGLYQLSLAGARVTDRGLKQLQPLENLMTLNLDRNDINGNGLAVFRGCAHLEKISLADTAMSATSVKNLLELTHLKEVDLSDTDVDEQALAILAQHPTLRRLNVRDTDLSVDTLKKLPPEITGSALFNQGVVELSDAREPKLQDIGPPAPLEQLPPADPSAMVKRLGGSIQRDEQAPGVPVIAVDLRGTQAADTDLAHLRDLQNLQKLNLEGCTRISDAGLAYLAGLGRLESLNLRRTSVRGDGLAHLQGLKNLVELLLPGSISLSSNQIQLLSKLPNLETLAFTVDDPALPKLRALARLPKLKQLDLSGIALSAHAMNRLKDFKNLETLTLGTRGVLLDRGLLQLKEIATLNKLFIPNYLGGDDGCEVFRNLVNLELLRIYGPRITDRGIGYLSACDRLEKLRLDRLNIGDAGLHVVRSLNKLVSLGLAHTQVTDKGLSALAENKDLEELDLSFTKVTDAGLARLAGIEELRTLILRGTAVKGSGLKALDRLSYLRTLCLDSTAVNDTELEPIGRLTTLQMLDLSHTRVTDAGLGLLRPLDKLEDIFLIDCPMITDKAVAPLKELRELKHVDVSGSPLSAKAIAQLRQAGMIVEAGGGGR